LERLLLVHGRWNFKRIVRLVLYFFYKNMLFGLTLFFFSMESFFSGQPVYNDVIMAAYNVIFVSLPVIAVGVLDQDVSESKTLENPPLYGQGQRRCMFTMWDRVGWLGLGVGQAFFLYYGVMHGVYGDHAVTSAGKAFSLMDAGMCLYTCVVIVVNLQLALSINYWTWLHHLTIWGSIVAWFLVNIIFSHLFDQDWSTDLYQLFLYDILSSSRYWLGVFLMSTTALLPSLAFRCIQREMFPEDHHIIQELAQSKTSLRTPSGVQLQTFKPMEARKSIVNRGVNHNMDLDVEGNAPSLSRLSQHGGFENKSSNNLVISEGHSVKVTKGSAAREKGQAW